MTREMKDEYLTVISKEAKGYTASEVVEEYVMDEEGLRLTKKKVTKKYISPDITAAKLLLDLKPDIENLTDKELESQIIKLKSLIMEDKEFINDLSRGKERA